MEASKEIGELEVGCLPYLQYPKGRRLQKLSFQDPDLSIPLMFCHYPELRDLNCSGCGLEKLRLRHNTELRSLDCHNNPLVNLNLRANRKLSSLNIRYILLKKKGSEWIHLPPDYITIQQK